MQRPRLLGGKIRLLRACCWCALFLAALTVQAQTAADLTIQKIDPPSWWARFPKPMLLVRGTGLNDAAFHLSDRTLSIERTESSANGHWALLWLNQSPAKAEQVRLLATRGNQHAQADYTFAEPKLIHNTPGSGFAGFSSRDVMYLIMPDRFADGDRTNDGPAAVTAANAVEAAQERNKPRGWHGGDLRGIQNHLDYLQELGVTTVWLTPVTANLGERESYHGYGATDLYAVDPHFGSLTDLQQLAAALHTRGMKLVLDQVPNHVGPATPWAHDPPTPAWFHGTVDQHLEAQSDFYALISPHAPEASRLPTLHGWFANVLPDMNTDDPTVATYLRQNTVWWVEQTGADGLRIDTFPYVNREFWAAYTTQLTALFPRLTEVGEIFNGDAVVTSSFAGGVTRAGLDTGLSTPFDYPMHFALRDVFSKGAPMTRITEVLAEDVLYPHPERLVPFLDNHDVERFARAGNATAARLAFATLLTMRGMPQLYAGDEIALPGGGDPDNRHDFPGGFSGLSNEPAADAFSPAGRTPEQAAMHDDLAHLAHLHTSQPALACGDAHVLVSQPDTLITLRDAGHAAADGLACGPATQSPQRLLIAVHRGIAAVINVSSDMSTCKPGAALLGIAKVSTSPTGLTLSLPADSVWIAPCEPEGR